MVDDNARFAGKDSGPDPSFDQEAFWLDETYPYDVEGVGDFESSQALKLRTNRSLKHWLRFARINPSLAEVEQHIYEIFDDLNLIVQVRGYELLAAKIVLELGPYIERLKRGKAWYYHLINLYGPIVDTASSEVIIKFQQAIIRNVLNQGDPMRLGATFDLLRSLISVNDHAAQHEVNLALASAALILANYADGLATVQNVITFATRVDNPLLLGKAYGVLSRLYLYQGIPQLAFEHAQMLYTIGAVLHEDTLIINGLHYMAAAFQLLDTPKAFPYLELAMQYANLTEDVLHIEFIWLTWATCRYYTGEYEEAVYFFKMCIRHLLDYGQYYAGALHGLGVSLVILGRYDEAEPLLNEALSIWRKYQRPVDELYTQHGLAELYSRTSRALQAVLLMETIIESAKRLQVDPYLLETMQSDLKLYRERGANEGSGIGPSTPDSSST